MTFGRPYGLPGHVLAWSMGIGYSRELPEPVIANDKLHPSFDSVKRRYRPDVEELRRLGYGEEGVRRLSMLGLMTEIVSRANGVPIVQVDTQLCQVIVRINNAASLKSKDGFPIISIVFSLKDAWAVDSNNHTLDLTTIDKFPSNVDEALITAAEITKSLIDKDLIDRPAITAGANKAAKVFS